jgi:FAD:protein FMN transferase
MTRNLRIITLIVFVAVLFQSCTNKKTVIENISGFIQGTTYSIVFDNKKNIDPIDLRANIEQVLHEFDMSLSLYEDSSVLAKLNRNEEVDADKFFTEAFIKSDSLFRITNGAFDVTIAPLVRAWGFGPDDHKNFRKEKLDSLKNLVGMEKVSLVDGKLVKSNPDVTLDFNAIAQGYSVDVIYNYMSDTGIDNFLVEIGGEVRAKGTKGGALWRIGIDRPEDFNVTPGQQLQAIIKISDQSIATSGNYRKFYIEDGVKYSHTIDPRTGYPAKNKLLSVTIIARECAIADGIATACMVMGKEDAIEFINSNPQLSAYIVYSDDDGNFKTWMSESVKKNIEETRE